MARQHKEGCCKQQELARLITDQQKTRLQEERQNVQKRTFTRWINMHLAKSVLQYDPPIEVLDLYEDIQDGRILMALLEHLSGCKLLYRCRPASHHIFKLNNISKSLAFLDDRHVKLGNIDASRIAEGNPAVVLALIWNIILFFQIKEVTSGLQKLYSSFTSLSINSYPSFGDLSPPPCEIITSPFQTLPPKGKRAAKAPKYNGKALNILLHWVQLSTSKFGVEVCDFSKSWMNGLAFLAMVKSVDPGLVDLWESLREGPKENVEEAFRVAELSLGIPRLLEPQDVISSPPDEQSIITYVSQFLQYYNEQEDVASEFGSVAELLNGKSTSQRSYPPANCDPPSEAMLPNQGKNKETWQWTKLAACVTDGPHTAVPHLPDSTASALPFTNNPSSTCLRIPIRRIYFMDNQPTTRLSSTQSSRPSKPDRDWLDTAGRTCPMEVTEEEQALPETGEEEGRLSLSSGEGGYALSALDSDEEEAYSYILGLNQDPTDPFESGASGRQEARGTREAERESGPGSTVVGLLDSGDARGSQPTTVMSGVRSDGFVPGRPLYSEATGNTDAHSRKSEREVERADHMSPSQESFRLKTRGNGTNTRGITEEYRHFQGSAKLLTEAFVEEGKKALVVTAKRAPRDEARSTKGQEGDTFETGVEDANERQKHAWCREGNGAGIDEEEEEILTRSVNNGEDEKTSIGIMSKDVEQREEDTTGTSKGGEESRFEDAEVEEDEMENDVFRERGIKRAVLTVEFRQRFGAKQHKETVITEETRGNQEEDEKIDCVEEEEAIQVSHLSKGTLAEGSEEMCQERGTTPLQKSALNVIPDSLTPSIGITRSEQDMLLILWILLYCYFVLPRINFLWLLFPGYFN